MRVVRTILTATFLFFVAISAQAQTADRPVGAFASSMAGFGADLLIDGNTIVVGRTGLSAMFPEPPSQWGGLHVFGVENGEWGELYSVSVDGAEMNEDFGRSMALMTGGDVLLVGAPRADSARGTIYLFHKEHGRFGYSTSFQLPDAQPHDSTGNRMAVSGNVVLIGVPGRKEVHAYRWSDDGWQAAGILAPSHDDVGRFPRSIAFDGNVALVGEPARDGGQVVVFGQEETGWTERGTIMSPDSVSQFGSAIALWADEAMIGASGSTPRGGGAVYHYRRTGDSWAVAQTLTPPDTTVHETIGWSRGAGF
ncbi:MAG: hypothetical protein O7E49_14465, partial [Gemmatimonadetes bacterium]|nr:hypothetical protein [Gemmatimonadota bacterium]